MPYKPKAALSGFPAPPPLPNFPKPAEKISKNELEKRLEHLYAKPLEKIVKRNENYEAGVAENMKKTVVHSPRKSGDLSAKETKMVESLYTDAIRRQKVKMEMLEKKYLPPPPTMKKMTSSDQEEALSRLYATCVSTKQKALEAAERRLYGVPVEPKKVSKDELNEAIDHLYKKSIERKQAELQRIEEEYAFKPKESKKLTKDEMTTVMDRLRQSNK